MRRGETPFLSYHQTILVGAVHLVLQHPHKRHAGAWKDPAVKANVYRPGWYRSGSLLHASRFGAGDEVQGVNPPDASVGVVECHVQALGGPRQVKVEQVAVTLHQHAVGVDDGDRLATCRG